MKANMPVTKQTTPAIEQAIFNKKMAEMQEARKQALLYEFRMGAHAVAKLALNTYEELIRNSTSFEQLQLHTNDLLDQLRHAVLPDQEQIEKESEVKSDE